MSTGQSNMGQPKIISIAEMTDSGLVVNPEPIIFKDADDFAQFLSRGSISALVDVTKDALLRSIFVKRFDELQEGHIYVEKESNIKRGIKEVRQEQSHLSKGREQEFSFGLCQELSNLGVAPKPVLRHDLRILTDGKQAQQEFDVVLLCGADRVVLGEHKSHLSSKNGVEELVKKAAIVRKLAKDGPEMYAPFRNKKLGLAFMAESIAVSAEQSVKKACKREGVALFRRSGAAVRLARSGVPPGRGIMRFA
eukprot:jgi/Astpho2/1097/Aster-08398